MKTIVFFAKCIQTFEIIKLRLVSMLGLGALLKNCRFWRGKMLRWALVSNFAYGLCWLLFHWVQAVITTVNLYFIFPCTSNISINILAAGWPSILQVHYTFQVVDVESWNKHHIKLDTIFPTFHENIVVDQYRLQRIIWSKIPYKKK